MSATGLRAATSRAQGLTALLAAACLILSACGGDDDDEEAGRTETQASNEAFITAADEICEDAEDAGEGAAQVAESYLDPNTDTELDDLVESLDEFIEESEDFLEQLAEVEAPTGEAGEMWAEALELAEEQVEEIEDVRDLAEERRTADTSFEEDAAAIQEAFSDPDFEDRSDELEDLAEELELDECFKQRR